MTMRKILALALSLATIGFVASSADAKAAGASKATMAVTANAVPQGDIRFGEGRRNRRYNRRVRTITQSRLVRIGRRVYRETYQITYLPNGRTHTRLISRVRVR